MRLNVELMGISEADVELFKKMNKPGLSVNIRYYEEYASITACGSYDDLMTVALKATNYKSFSIHLQ